MSRNLHSKQFGWRRGAVTVLTWEPPGSRHDAAVLSQLKIVFDELAPFVRTATIAEDRPAWFTEASTVYGYAYELYRRAYQSRHGLPQTLGQRLTAEGLACWYAQQAAADAAAPWTRGRISQHARDHAKRHWNDQHYPSHAWLENGPLGKWIGYRLGYRLATLRLGKSGGLSPSFAVTATILRQQLSS